MSCGVSAFKPNLKLIVCLPSNSKTQCTTSPVSGVSMSSLTVNFKGISFVNAFGIFDALFAWSKLLKIHNFIKNSNSNKIANKN